jgi:hypothetical protein
MRGRTREATARQDATAGSLPPLGTGPQLVKASSDGYKQGRQRNYTGLGSKGTYQPGS